MMQNTFKAQPIDDLVAIEDIVDRVAANPDNANDAKKALRKMVKAHEASKPFSRRPRRSVAEIDDDMFDNMPV